MNEQKPLGYVTTVSTARLQNGGTVEYIYAQKPTNDCHAVYLWPDPAADKLRARIRVLEAESTRTNLGDMAYDEFLKAQEALKRMASVEEQLARESAKVGQLASDHDALVHSLDRAQKELDALQPGAAEWLDVHCPNGWGCNISVTSENGWYAFEHHGSHKATKYYPTTGEAREALARALGWPGPAKQAARPAVEAPPVGSRGGSGTPTCHRATSCEGTAKGPIATGCDVKADPPQCCGTCDAWEPDGTTMPDHDRRGDLLRGATSCGVSIPTGHSWGSHCPAYRRRGTFPIKDSSRFPFTVILPKPSTFESLFGASAPANQHVSFPPGFDFTASCGFGGESDALTVTGPGLVAGRWRREKGPTEPYRAEYFGKDLRGDKYQTVMFREHENPAFNGDYRRVRDPRPDGCLLPAVGIDIVFGKDAHPSANTLRRCPLPAVGAWKYGRNFAYPKGVAWVCWEGVYGSFVARNGSLWRWEVHHTMLLNTTIASGERKTRKGAERAAEIAARRAWRMRNGGAK